MADSLRDQLLKSGIVKQVQQDRAREPKRPAAPSSGKPVRKGGKPHAASHAARPSGQSQQDIDLAKAYALRAQTEARERQRVEREAAEQSRLRRERKQKIQQLLDGKALNKADADQPRNFEYGGKIRRVHVDAAQLAALNAGELGVVQQGGRYLLVSREIAEQVRDIDPHQLALLVDPNAAGAGDDGVPDDLMW
ncbi:DUF2058 family protein [Rhodanobacter denitrificans]|uniref:DUF2058 domain-containing protein n=1 Tax=Rhodanobacter denitrificans TaxID=666685 RepID=I4WR76_9GAMM|nr:MULTISPECIES: DUF2058 family protein [Rhodanobacter]AGG89352.1 hypothetical protein R2APBS1_2244 [Rhodanobacter denitrificans]EIM01968.1 nucleoprotein/polynucleotide-associated enzyme [Rhodanobacter denitrificans]UJM88236.1 DUF2058 family protein [Rhodanobacter denitrificans]UJM88750.1 DUF2058 family protein [Rhodanobacter denitrificans]